MARGGVFNKPPPYKFYGPKALARQANRQVRQSIAAQQAPIKTAQALADARAAAAQKAIQGFGLAGASILRDAAPLAGDAYRQAGQAESTMAAGFAGQTAQDVRNTVAQQQAMIDRLAPGGQMQAPNTEGMQNALYEGSGFIPGSSNEQQAANAITAASAQPGIQEGRTLQAVQGSVAQQAQDDQQYVQDMLDLAKQEPQLRTQIMQQLQANELAKRNAYVQQQAQNMVNRRFNVSAGQAQQRINIERQQGNARIALSKANLRLSQSRDRQAVRQALIQGHRIDSSASHARGYLVDRNGNPILGKGGKHIPVHEASGSGSGGANTGPGSTSYKEAYRHATSSYIDPGLGTDGNGHKIPDPTFTRPPFPHMVSQLVNGYGLTRGQARKLLIGMGIKPNGKRPGK